MNTEHTAMVEAKMQYLWKKIAPPLVHHGAQHGLVVHNDHLGGPGGGAQVQCITGKRM